MASGCCCRDHRESELPRGCRLGRQHAILASHYPFMGILEALAQAAEVLVGQVNTLAHFPHVVVGYFEVATEAVQF